VPRLRAGASRRASRPRVGKLDLLEDDVDEAVEELVLAGDVVVHRHRLAPSSFASERMVRPGRPPRSAMATAAFSSDEQQGIAAIQRAHELGVTFVDTAELYGWGENEKVLGRAIRGFRDEVVIASKFGFTRDYGLDSRPEHIREVINNSLRHLDVDHIDVFHQHRVDPHVPIETSPAPSRSSSAPAR
jgi:hypothetical protein